MPQTGADGGLLGPVDSLPGVGQRRLEQLNRLKIQTVFDLLHWFPRAYEDWSSPLALADLPAGQPALFVAAVRRQPALSRTGRLSVLRTVLTDGKTALEAVWFNQPWLKSKLQKGQTYRFYGLVRQGKGTLQVQNPSFEAVTAEAGGQPSQPYRPLYGLTEGLSQGVLRALIQKALDQVKDQLPEGLPDWIRHEHQLATASFALERIHQPQSDLDAQISRKRLAFEELFLLRCGLYALRQKKRQLSRARSLDPGRDQEKLQAWIQQLPFKLTGAQERVWSDIEADLRAQEPMNRLLQGDVGSGKTVVAALAMLQCALAGGQAVLMAPTSILAVQHHKTLTGLLAGSGFEPALLTGASRPAQRRLLLEALASGQQRLLVGTHALIEQAVRFQNLALAITDEQHRFGVRQRKQLAARKEQTDLAPHVLVMSATPIPRSLALILYGDLDLSLLDERPAGRAPVATYTATSQDQARLQDLMARTVSRGEQVYVICPMVEEQEDLDLQAAISRFQDLSQEAAGRWRTGLVHGRMRPEEKEDQMGRFMAGETDVLVSTTVVEVGVDNPRATLMVIENAERFGLAQLHQLRGRVGRSSLPSVCVLVSDSREGLARKRLQVLCKTQDGFAIAEQDLKLRGPGDFFGTRQHGLPDLKLVNLYEDRDLMAAVDRALDQLIDKDPDLKRPEHQALVRQIAARFPDLAQIGL